MFLQASGGINLKLHLATEISEPRSVMSYINPERPPDSWVMAEGVPLITLKRNIGDTYGLSHC